VITSEQVKAARGLIRWDQKDLSAASGISLPAIKRLEQMAGPLAAQSRTVDAIIAAFGKAGVEFINGDEPGVKLKARRSATKPKKGD
jgi:transcriptional regulator with XRE-family HTH domain